ncbi:MAG: hypothetical protein AB7S26_14365 [Sandaracinaceae bacterium]
MRLVVHGFATAVLLGACGAPASGTEYIAQTSDLAGFRSWIAFDRGDDHLPPNHVGPSWIYLSDRPPAGATSFPLGTRIVRVQERGDDMTAWEVHAMVKRGGGYNADGTPGWEMFELSLDASGGVVVVWRGRGPPDGDGYMAGDGGVLVSCNQCHGAAGFNDSVLSPVLELDVLAPPEE